MILSAVVGLVLVAAAIAGGALIEMGGASLNDRLHARLANYTIGQMAPGWPPRFHLLRWRR